MPKLLASAASNGSEVEWCGTCERVVIGRLMDDALVCPTCCEEVEECERWAELELHLDDGEYLITILGQSSVPGETVRRTTHRVQTRDEVVQRLRIRGRLTGAARELLAKAGLAVEG